MLRKKYDIESKKYGINGVIYDYGVLIKLNFKYEGKEIEIALSRPFPFEDNALQKLGEDTIESYIENLSSENNNERKLMLHYWYIENEIYVNVNFIIAHGIVTGHNRLADSIYIDTSEVREIIIDKENEEAIVKTRNSTYYCPLVYCEWEKQEKDKSLIPEFDLLKAKYQNKIKQPTIEEDKVLLVLSNFNEYYFNSLFYKPKGRKKEEKYYAKPHIGMIQDSYIIGCENESIDIRYFPHFQNIEFYSEQTDGKPLYVENIGDVTLFVKSSKGLIKLQPGDRKEISKENAEKKIPILPRGDLYPAGIQI